MHSAVSLTQRSLMKHQRFGLRILRVNGGCAGLFMAPGVGKTLTAIRYAQTNLPALVICRRDDFLTWEDELTMEGYRLDDMQFIASAKDLEKWVSSEAWTFVTYDLIKNPAVFVFIKSTRFRLVIADESHMIKRWESQRTKKVVRATRHIKQRIAMTGSPITNEPIDAFSQCLFIDNGRTFGNSLWKFRSRYYLKSGPGWYKRRKAPDEIARKLRNIAYHVHEDDVLVLPPIRHLTKAVPLSPRQKKEYERVLHEWEVQIKDSTLEIDHVIVQLSKLKQIASGFVYDENKKAHWFKRSTKLQLIKDLLENDLKEKKKIIIWCSFTAEIERLHEELKDPHVVFYGKLNRQQRTEARKRFRDDPECRLFIGQVDAGVGMNELICADTAIYYSNSFKVVSKQQSMRRNRRKGSEVHKLITYYELVSEGTVDTRVIKGISSSMSLASYILSQLKKGHSLRRLVA